MLNTAQSNEQLGTLTITDANGVESTTHGFNVIREQFNCEMRGVVNVANLLRSKLSNINDLHISLTRNLSDDTFSFEVSRLNLPLPSWTSTNPQRWPRSFPVIAYNLDNKYYGDSYNGDEIFSPDPRNPFRIHRSLIGDTTINQFSSLTIDLRESLDNQKIPAPGVAERDFEIANLTFFPHFFPIMKNIVTNESNGIIYQMIKKITVVPRMTTTTRHDIWTLNDQDFQISIEYCNFLILSPQIRTSDFNQNVAEIYIYNEDGSSPIHDYKLDTHEGSMRSSSFNGKMNLSIDEKRQDHFRLKIIQGNVLGLSSGVATNDVLYVGNINLLDSTYYDYEKKQTQIGYFSGAEIGEIIPYNFFGEYSRDVEFSIAKSLEAFHMHVHKTIAAPMLNSFFGRVKLRVESVSENFPQTHHTIDAQILRRIREQIKANNLISLTGLENFV